MLTNDTYRGAKLLYWELARALKYGQDLEQQTGRSWQYLAWPTCIFLVTCFKNILLDLNAVSLAPVISVCHSPAISFYLAAGHTLLYIPARCPWKAQSETARQPVWGSKESCIALQWTHFLESSFYHHHLIIFWTGYFIFLFGLIYTFY